MKTNIKSDMNLRLVPALSLGAIALAATPNLAHAQTQGSNVLNSVLERLTNPSKFELNSGDWQDGVCGNLAYAPTGTGAAERSMCGGSQATGLMARPLLQPVICGANCSGDQGNAIQARLATNSITLLRNNGKEDQSCDTKIGGENWEEVIRTLYAGADGSGSAEACSAPERVALLQNWSSLWTNGCADPSPCTEVHHLYRPDENSGMGQVFAFFLSIRNYCNGSNQEDNDPIRRPCRRNERYCPNGQDLGVVLPVKLPVPSEVPDLDPYFAAVNNTAPCERGNWEFATDVTGEFTRCLDGVNPFAGFLCLYPRDAQNRFGCNNDQFGTNGFNPFMDGRVYNEIPLSARARLAPRTPNQDFSDWREYYRIHAGCEDAGKDNSEIIGCTVRQSECSIGWGSMRIQKETNTYPAVAIAELADLPINQRGYPLNQFLYLNTVNGFDTATGEEAKLVDCVRNHPERVAAAVQDAGFLPFAEVAERPVTCDSPEPQ